MYKKRFVLILLSLLLTLMSCSPKEEVESLYTVPHCVTSQSQCLVDNELGQFTVLFNVDKVHGDIPFELSIVYTSAAENIKFSAYLEGKDMFMGKIPVFFTKAQNENKQTSEVLLANCSEEQMVWRLWVTIEAQDMNQPELKKNSFFIDFTSTRL
jgi:hypothetical protein